MTSFPILDLIAGLIFIYFLLALINNSCIELYSGFIGLRSEVLTHWIKKTFGDVAGKITDHVLLNGMSSPGKSAHYMNAKSFAKTIAELVYTSAKESAENKDTITTSSFEITNLNDAITKSAFPPEIKTLLRSFIAKTSAQKKMNAAVSDVDHFEEQIEQWFNAIMERLTGHYKRKTVWYTFVFASIITVALNIDSLQLASYLYSNPDARLKLAHAAYTASQDSSYIKKVSALQQKMTALAKDSATTDSVHQVAHSLNDLVNQMKNQKAAMDTAVASMNLYIPIGWPDKEYAQYRKQSGECWYVLKKLGGLIMTILAICLGAPFWFDVLSKVANLRSSLKPDDKKNKPLAQ